MYLTFLAAYMSLSLRPHPSAYIINFLQLPSRFTNLFYPTYNTVFNINIVHIPVKSHRYCPSHQHVYEAQQEKSPPHDGRYIKGERR